MKHIKTEIQAMRDVVKAAKDFRDSINCFSMGVVVLCEEYVREKDDALQLAFTELEEAIKNKLPVNYDVIKVKVGPSPAEQIEAMIRENE